MTCRFQDIREEEKKYELFNFSLEILQSNILRFLKKARGRLEIWVSFGKRGEILLKGFEEKGFWRIERSGEILYEKI